MEELNRIKRRREVKASRKVTCALFGLLLLNGCAVTNRPPAGLPALAPAPPTGAVPTVVAVAAPSTPPLTLPQFLGLDALASGVWGGARCLRLKLASRFPVLQPNVVNPPRPIGDPANLASPSPAVATAAAAQQAAADAPAKAAALGYLATLGCQQHPQAEEAFLAGLDDISEVVRSAAVQAILDSQRTCGGGCRSCAGCCTPAIRARLTQLAYDRIDNCYCEPSSKVRRLARLALSACGGPAFEQAVEMPLELPPPAVLESLQVRT